MKKDRLIYLLEKYSNDVAEASEREELFAYLDSGENKELFTSLVADLLLYQSESSFDTSPYQHLARVAVTIDKNKADDGGVQQTLPVVRQVRFPGKWRWAAAAIILMLVTGMAIFFSADRQSNDLQKTITTAAVIPPGKEGAVLTLADGSQVVLDSLGDGLIAAQNGSQVLLKNGRIAYNVSGNETSDVTYNTMTTPKGRQFQIILPDGTKVWLNAASAIRYPTVFAGKERKVFVTGEAYFEVAQNAKQPFFLQIDDQALVEVLGTNFNVNAYENEHTINTTLLEGSVRVSPLLGADALLSGGKEGSFAFAQDDKGLAQDNKGLAEDDKGLAEDDKRRTQDNKRLIQGVKGLTEDDKRRTLDNKRLIQDDKRLAQDNERLAQDDRRRVQVNKSVVITPGQQARLRSKGTMTEHSSPAADQLQVVNIKDIDKVLAWKNGFINFDGATLDEIMRQLERWYDIEVVYENNKIPDKRLAGAMTRDVPLNGLLKNLEELGVSCKLKGRTLIITQ